MREISERQANVLALIQQHVAQYGRPPTVRWLGEQLGIKSTNAVNDHLRALERKGAISRDPLIARGITLLGEYGSAHAGTVVPPLSPATTPCKATATGVACAAVAKGSCVACGRPLDLGPLPVNAGPVALLERVAQFPLSQGQRALVAALQRQLGGS